MERTYKLIWLLLVCGLALFIYIHCHYIPHLHENDCVLIYTNSDRNVLLQSGIRPFFLLKIKKIDNENQTYLVENFINARASYERNISFMEFYSYAEAKKIKCSKGYRLLEKVMNEP